MKAAAILFDLLTGLLDSWSLWNSVAGDPDRGLTWRKAYLELTYAAGKYLPYEDLVAASAAAVGLPVRCARQLIERWDELQQWPEATHVLTRLHEQVPLGVVTNCSEELAQRAVARAGSAFDVVVSAERAGYYKPHARPYQLALQELGCNAGEVVFVAGSPYDVSGASLVGMRVIWHDRAGLQRQQQLAPSCPIIQTLSELESQTREVVQ